MEYCGIIIGCGESMFVDLVGPPIPQIYNLQTYYKDIDFLKCAMNHTSNM